MSLFEIFGTLAAICMVFGYLPQAIYTIRTRDTDAIALPTFLLMGLGSIFFIIQGFYSEPVNIPLIVTNSITAVSSAIVFGIKIYNDYISPRKKYPFPALSSPSSHLHPSPISPPLRAPLKVRLPASGELRRKSPESPVKPPP